MALPQTAGSSNLEAFRRILAEIQSAESQHEVALGQPERSKSLDPRTEGSAASSDGQVYVVGKEVLPDRGRRRPLPCIPTAARQSSPVDTKPFKRCTVRWNQGSTMPVRQEEMPNEDWTDWSLIQEKDNHRWDFTLVQERRFDQWGTIKGDLLYIRTGGALWNLLRARCRELLRSTDKGVWSSEDDESSEGGGGSIEGDAIAENNFMALYHLKRSITQQVQEDQLEKLWPGLEADLDTLWKFLDHTFPGIGQLRDEVLRTGRVKYGDLPALFEPRSIIYEKRRIPPFDTSYEQCFRLVKSEPTLSNYDGVSTLRLAVEEITYSRDDYASFKENPRSGTFLVKSTRYIRRLMGGRMCQLMILVLFPGVCCPSEIKGQSRPV